MGASSSGSVGGGKGAALGAGYEEVLQIPVVFLGSCKVLELSMVDDLLMLLLLSLRNELSQEPCNVCESKRLHFFCGGHVDWGLRCW